uniref:Indole-3-acetate beta-glucosyltransferase n=1 Tax=Cajanus cajan TaxID=3821 RepID=A0A151RGP2_CAJCA|nr:Indole-3-acetate beta-glucosyltransferase [Cajanus cajan]
MENQRIRSKAHCLVLSYPGQGHINPMIQFSKLLERQGVRITLVTTRSYSKNLLKVPHSMALETISDGFDEGGIAEAGSYKAYLDRFHKVGPETLAQVLEKLGESKNHVDCLIYDSFFPWALDVAKRFGIVGASYLTQDMAVNNIYYHVHLGKLRAPLTQHEISLPKLPRTCHRFSLRMNKIQLSLILRSLSSPISTKLTGSYAIHSTTWIKR